MKLLVETTGPFQLLDDETRQLIRSVGQTVVQKTGFVERFAMLGHLKLVAQLAEEATDTEWKKTIAECKDDLTLAVESFKSMFPLGGKADTPPADETKKKK